MDSIRKLVLENENNRRTFQVISRFLKEMGWWAYWKEYVATDKYKSFARRFPNENWVECKDPYNVFGSTNFSRYLEVNHSMRVMTVLDIFIVYTHFFYPELSDGKWDIGEALRNSPYVFKKGLYEKWEKESKLIKLNA